MSTQCETEQHGRTTAKEVAQALQAVKADILSKDFSVERSVDRSMDRSLECCKDGQSLKPLGQPCKESETSSDFGRETNGASTPTVEASAAVATAEHEKTKRELARVSYELDAVKVDKSKLEQEVLELKEKLSDQDKANARVVEDKDAQELPLRAEIRSLEQKLDQMRLQRNSFDEEKRNLRCEVTMAEDKILKLEDELQRALEKFKKAEGARNNWYNMYFQRNRDNHALQRAVEEHRNTIWDLETAAKQERAAAKVMTPGDYFKMMKASEPMNLQQQNVELKRELDKARQDLDNVLYQLAAPRSTRSMMSKEDLPPRW